MPNPVPQLIEPFLNVLKFEKRYSPHTIRAYHDDLVQFFDYLATQYGGVELREISSLFIRSWLASLKDKKLTAKSLNRKLSTLKSFFKYQMRVGVMTATPMVNISAPKIAKRLPDYLQKHEIARLLRDLKPPQSWKEETGRLLIEIFYNTGMRLSELVNLKESFIDSGNKTLKVLGKGNKERIIPISPALLKKIKNYQQTKRKEFEHGDDVLLVGSKGKKMSHKSVYRIVQNCLETVTTLNKKSPHVLRHTFATHLSNNGADLNSVKELLGHASLASTQVYTHTTIEKLKDIHKKAHPKS